MHWKPRREWWTGGSTWKQREHSLKIEVILIVIPFKLINLAGLQNLGPIVVSFQMNVYSCHSTEAGRFY